MLKSITLICDRCGAEKVVSPTDKLVVHRGIFAVIREPYLCPACSKLTFRAIVDKLRGKSQDSHIEETFKPYGSTPIEE